MSEAMRFLGRLVDSSQPGLNDQAFFRSEPFWPGTYDAVLGVNFNDPIGFAYAPSIVYYQNQFHMFMCAGDYSSIGFDLVRYCTSADGVAWTRPRILMRVSNTTEEGSACDPCVIHFGRHFHLFYSGNLKLSRTSPYYETVMFVARCSTLNGQYEKWTHRGTWEVNASDPQPIMYSNSAIEHCNPIGRYGAGQQNVIQTSGHKLVSWHCDDTYVRDRKEFRVVYSTSNDGVNWTIVGPVVNTGGAPIVAESMDVKYDTASRMYVMYHILPSHREAGYLERRESRDGIVWSEPEVACDAFCFPNFTHNVGVSGDEYGNYGGPKKLLAYGGPHMSDVNSRYRIPDYLFKISEPRFEAGDIQMDIYGHEIGRTTGHPRGYFSNTGAMYYSDGESYIAFVRPDDFGRHKRLNPTEPDLNPLERSFTEFGNCLGSWH
jgi:hypothetical protein